MSYRDEGLYHPGGMEIACMNIWGVYGNIRVSNPHTSELLDIWNNYRGECIMYTFVHKHTLQNIKLILIKGCNDNFNYYETRLFLKFLINMYYLNGL